jgi:DNA-binding MarR family transcriptional regulator
LKQKNNNREKLIALMGRMESSGMRHMPMREYDLTLAQIGLLAFMARHPGAHIQTVAEGMDLTPPTVSVAVRKLEESGWLRREPDERDRRASCVFLTERAAHVIQKVMRERQEKMDRLLDSLTTREQSQLLNLLEKAIIHMEKEFND